MSRNKINKVDHYDIATEYLVLFVLQGFWQSLYNQY